MRDHITIPGVACPCGSAELRVVAPGTEAVVEARTGVMLQRPVPVRGWCCLDHQTRSAGAKPSAPEAGDAGVLDVSPLKLGAVGSDADRAVFSRRRP